MHGASNMGHAINHLVVCAEDYFSLVKITCMLADSFVQWFLDNGSGSSKDAADTMMDGLSVLCVLFTPSFRYSSMPKPTMYQTSSSLLPVNNRCMGEFEVPIPCTCIVGGWRMHHHENWWFVQLGCLVLCEALYAMVWLCTCLLSIETFLKQLNSYGRSWAPTFWQASLRIGNFYDFSPLLAFDS